MDNELETTVAPESNETEQLKQEIANLKNSLNYERSRRKEAEKRNNDEFKEIEAEKAKIKAQLASGKSALSDDVIDDLMSTFGTTVAETKVKQEKANFDKSILELMRDYPDAEEYSDDIKPLVRQGLTPEQAYWAVAGKNRVANSNAKAIAEHDEELKKEELKARAKAAAVATPTSGTTKTPTYTAKERSMADTLGKSVEEIKARNKASFSIDEILSMHKKFNKEEN